MTAQHRRPSLSDRLRSWWRRKRLRRQLRRWARDRRVAVPSPTWIAANCWLNLILFTGFICAMMWGLT